MTHSHWTSSLYLHTLYKSDGKTALEEQEIKPQSLIVALQLAS